MTSRILHFCVDGRKETAEFRSDDSLEEVRDLFRTAAAAGKHDTLKLYNHRGNVVSISPHLESNTADSAYLLDVIPRPCDSLATDLGYSISKLERRLHALEVHLARDGGGSTGSSSGGSSSAGAVTRELMLNVKQQVESLTSRLEHVFDCSSWIGVGPDVDNGTAVISNRCSSGKQELLRKQREAEHKLVLEKFQQMCYAEVSHEVRCHLRDIRFNNWEWDDAEMLILLRQMYIDLGFVAKFNISMPTLHSWLFELYRHYNHVPFHNFKHSFMVTQMMYGLVTLLDLRNHLDDEDVLALLTACICHDLDHPGYNNMYQINARTELALLYNDISPLENHHACVAFGILQRPECNIFRNLTPMAYKRVRERMIRCILATDMARHSEILAKFNGILHTFDFKSQEHKDTLMMILIKCADISNECRPVEVAEPWIDCLLQEFFNQSDKEKMEGLPVSAFMDREKVDKCSSQIGFIKFVLLPLYQSLAELFPHVKEPVITPLTRALQYYSLLHQQQADKQPASS